MLWGLLTLAVKREQQEESAAQSGEEGLRGGAARDGRRLGTGSVTYVILDVEAFFCLAIYLLYLRMRKALSGGSGEPFIPVAVLLLQ